MDQKIKKDIGKNRLDLIPVECIEALGKVLTFGAKKYHDHSWREGINYSRVYAAVQRHLNAFWGEADDIDEESGLSHLSHAFCGLTFLIAYEANKERYRTFDDRVGSHNEAYVIQEEMVNKIISFVHHDKSGLFVGGFEKDNCLDKVYAALLNASTNLLYADQPDYPDLTKMTHPEACEYLKPGMRVKVLGKATTRDRGWENSWLDTYMDKAIYTIYTILTIHPSGVTFKDSDGFGFPAFVLEIVNREEIE